MIVSLIGISRVITAFVPTALPFTIRTALALESTRRKIHTLALLISIGRGMKVVWWPSGIHVVHNGDLGHGRQLRFRFCRLFVFDSV
jgi:hypothetical protein